MRDKDEFKRHVIGIGGVGVAVVGGGVCRFARDYTEGQWARAARPFSQRSRPAVHPPLPRQTGVGARVAASSEALNHDAAGL